MAALPHLEAAIQSMRADWAFRKGRFKETRTQTECFRERVKRGVAAMYSVRKVFFFSFKSCKCFLADPKNSFLIKCNMCTLKGPYFVCEN